MSIYEFGPFQLDAEQLLLSLDGEPIALGPKVVETLLGVIEHPHEVLSKSALLDRIWPEGYVEEANLAQNIYVLRKTFRAHWNMDPIATVPRRGYRFDADVRRIERVHTEPEVVRVAPRHSVWKRPLTALGALAACLGLIFGGVATAMHERNASSEPQLSARGERLYTIGKYYWNQRSPSGVQKSIEYFTQVIDSDPHDARGYAALAGANAIMGDYTYGKLKPQIYFDRARDYAKKALLVDPRSGEAHAVLGMLDTDMQDTHHSMHRGTTELQTALALDPKFGPAHQWYGIALLGQGKVREAIREFQIAASIDPLSVAATMWLSSAAFIDRHYDEALAYANQALDLSPTHYEAYEQIGTAYEAQHDYARAVSAYRVFEKHAGLKKPEADALLAHAYAMLNDGKRAHAALAIAIAHPKRVSPEDVAIAFVALGDAQSALKWLRKIRDVDDRVAVRFDPRFDVVRKDARFRPYVGASPA